MHPETDLVVIVDAWESINPITHTGIHNHMRKTHPQLCKLIDQLLAPKANKMIVIAFPVTANKTVRAGSSPISIPAGTTPIASSQGMAPARNTPNNPSCSKFMLLP